MKIKNLFLILLIGLLIVMPIVGAIDAGEIASKAKTAVWDPITDMFSKSGWTEGNLSPTVAKWLVFALVTMLIFSIVKLIPIIKDHAYMRWPVSIIVAFLGTAYLTKEEIAGALMGYGAMALVLAGIIPLIILIFFSVEMSKGAGGGAGRVINYLIWIAFIVFMGYKMYSGYFVKHVIGKAEIITYGAIIIISVCFILFNKQIMRLLFKEEYKAIEADKIRDIASELEADILRREERSSELTGGAKTAWDRNTELKRKELKRIQGKLP